MNTHQNQAKAIFLRAVEIPSADERRAYVAAQCKGDENLHREVNDLLQHHQGLGSFLEAPAAPQAVTYDQPVAQRLGTMIGPYKLLQQIGEGGMGIVWMAEQTQPVHRKVALKVIKPGMDSNQVIARFEAERQALAMMDHANIARVLDAGATESGRPYFVMELVHGVPITKYCDDNHLTPRERLDLFVPVCQAIHHAHQKGIIHRDIKPSNVMITLYDGKPVPKVIDFGVAKATEQKLTDRTLFTQYGTMVGTFEYMSPEQAEMSALGVDTRSDIFSLGVLMYELLTGSTPLSHRRVREAAYAEILRMIKEEEPPRPSTRLSDSGTALTSIAAQRRTDPAQLTKLLRGELDWIVLKALEKNRNRRYESASALAADVRRYLQDEPVEACPPSARYRFHKFARKNKGKLGVAACLILVLTTFAGGVGWVLQERAGRAARTAYQVELVLEEAARPQQDKKWSEALALVNRAEGLFAGGQGSDELRERLRQARAALEQGLRQARADQRMAAEVVEIRLRFAEVKDDHFDWEGAAHDYAAVFRQYGIDIERLEIAEAAARIRGREIASELVAAVDHWATVRMGGWPKDPGWRHLLGVAKAADGDTFRNQVRAALERGDHEALLHLATAANVAALPPATLLNLAKALQEMLLPQEAVGLLQRAQREYPGDFWLNHQLAFALAHSQPPQHQKAIPYYTAAVALRKSPGVYLNFAISLGRSGALDEAIAALKEAIRLKPDYAAAHFDLGNGFGKKGQLDQAIAAFKEAIRLKPDFSAAHKNLGFALCENGRLDDAIAALKESIRLKPDDPGAHYGLGRALCENGQLDDAIAVLKESIRLKPDDPGAHYGLGRALSGKGQQDEAIAAYKESIRLKPSAGAHVNLGVELHRAGRPDEAIVAYKEALRLKPDFALAHSNIGNALLDKGQLDQAIGAYHEAIRLQADSTYAHSHLGFALGRKGQLPQAVDAYRRALQLKPDTACIEVLRFTMKAHEENGVDCFFLAMAHWQLGEREQARKWYQQAIAWMENNQPNDEKLRRFRAEAEELLKQNSGKKELGARK